MQLLQPRMPNEYCIHVYCLLSLPTETVWSLYAVYGINKKIMFDINMYDLSDLPKSYLSIVFGELECCLMAQKIINSLTTIILSILFPLTRWVTIEMPSNSSPTFPITTGELATAKRTPCDSDFLSSIQFSTY